MTYTKCPDCGKKGVTSRMRPNGEDHMGCRYCPFYFFTATPESSIDKRARERWEAVNQLCEVCGADIAHDHGRCTNGRCAKCHREHCTPGGITYPGHARGPVATPFSR